MVFAGTLQGLCTERVEASPWDPALVNEVKSAPLSEPLVAPYLGGLGLLRGGARWLKSLFFG